MGTATTETKPDSRAREAYTGQRSVHCRRSSAATGSCRRTASERGPCPCSSCTRSTEATSSVSAVASLRPSAARRATPAPAAPTPLVTWHVRSWRSCVGSTVRDVGADEARQAVEQQTLLGHRAHPRPPSADRGQHRAGAEGAATVVDRPCRLPRRSDGPTSTPGMTSVTEGDGGGPITPGVGREPVDPADSTGVRAYHPTTGGRDLAARSERPGRGRGDRWRPSDPPAATREAIGPPNGTAGPRCDRAASPAMLHPGS